MNSTSQTRRRHNDPIVVRLKKPDQQATEAELIKRGLADAAVSDPLDGAGCYFRPLPATQNIQQHRYPLVPRHAGVDCQVALKGPPVIPTRSPC
jgi:hypothetical protein